MGSTNRTADKDGMARVIAALLFFFIGSADAQAQTNWDNLSKTPERLIGILDLPDIVAGGCGPAPASSHDTRVRDTFAEWTRCWNDFLVRRA